MSDFVAFARSHGLVLDHVIADGRWHRCQTTDKPKKRNGAYLFDGERGVVKNFATMQDYAAYRVGWVDKVELRAQRAIQNAQEKARHEEARHRAQEMVRRAVVDIHPYLKLKGFPDELALVLDGDLLVPMREFTHYARINSIQRIAADGSKLFLPGGKAKGSVFIIGWFTAEERWLVEGYATGLSVWAALRELHRRAQVVVCFSAGNLSHIGRLVKELRPKAYVFADNDKSGAGAKAAEGTGLPWVMAPEEGMDANDLHRAHGLRALVKVVRGEWTTNTVREMRAMSERA